MAAIRRASFQQVTSGPIPSAAELERYREIAPDIVPRILAGADDERAMRHEMGRRGMAVAEAIVKDEMRRSWVGMFLGFVVALAGLALAAFSVWQHQPLAGTAIVAIDLGTVVGVFVLGKRRRAEEVAAEEGAD